MRRLWVQSQAFLVCVCQIHKYWRALQSFIFHKISSRDIIKQKHFYIGKRKILSSVVAYFQIVLVRKKCRISHTERTKWCKEARKLGPVYFAAVAQHRFLFNQQSVAGRFWSVYSFSLGAFNSWAAGGGRGSCEPEPGWRCSGSVLGYTDPPPPAASSEEPPRKQQPCRSSAARAHTRQEDQWKCSH